MKSQTPKIHFFLAAVATVFAFSGFYYRKNLPNYQHDVSENTNKQHDTDQKLSGLAPISCDFEDYSPINLVSPPMEQGGRCTEADVCPSIFLSLDRVWNEINNYASDNMSHFIMNVGANDGVHADPLFPLLEQRPEISGLYVEIDPDLVASLEVNMQPYANIEIVKDGIHPGNAVNLLKRGKHSGIDIFKFDIDSCECHILDTLMQDKYFHNIKVIQLELNHNIPPPIVYKDMCMDNKHGRDSQSKDVWGCSMQAAYDIVKNHGFVLLQYDWPDAVFIHQDYIPAFPKFFCKGSRQEQFLMKYWLGYHHAKENYQRFRIDQDKRDKVEDMQRMAVRSSFKPAETLDWIFNTWSEKFGKRPLWIELGVSGTDAYATVVVKDDKVVMKMMGAI